jgi:hypothetical protein
LGEHDLRGDGGLADEATRLQAIDVLEQVEGPLAELAAVAERVDAGHASGDGAGADQPTVDVGAAVAVWR